MNILIEFGSGAEDFDDEVYSCLLSKMVVGNCALIHHNKENLVNRKITKYVTHSFFAPPLWRGDYSEAIEYFGEGAPVDPWILDAMSKCEHEVMVMLLRWSEGKYTDTWHEYCRHVRFWNNVLDQLKIDVFFTTEIVHTGYNYVIYLLCKLKNIKYISTQRISYPERLHVALDVREQLPFFREEFAQLCEKYRNKSLKDIVLREDINEMYEFYTGNKDKTPEYMKNTMRPRRRKWAVWGYDNSRAFRWIFDVYANNNFFGKRARAIIQRGKYISKLLINIFSFNSAIGRYMTRIEATTSVFREAECLIEYYESRTKAPDYKENYIYVPLHYQPEQTTSPLGGRFVDQLLMIRMLSYYLPEGWYVYVKEHPSFKDYETVSRATWRSEEFYNELVALKNVKLISMKENTFELIDEARAVAVVTGTAGLEAATTGKCCLMFGYSYLQYAPNVITVRSNKDCKNAVDNLLGGRAIDEDWQKKMKLYFKLLEEYFFVGKILWYDAPYRKNYLQDRDSSCKNIVRAYKKELSRLFGDDVFI